MKILKVAVALTMPVMILLFSIIAVVMDDNFYYDQFEQNNIYVEVPETDEIYYNLSYYLIKGGELDESYYTSEEIMHLRDVKHLVGMSSYILVMLIFFSVCITAYFFVKKDYGGVGTALLAGGIISLVGSIIFALLAYFSFADFFLTFHKILFKNSFWMLSNNDILIKMFPESFFVAAARKTIMSCILLSSLSLVKGIVLRVLPGKV